MIEAQRLTRRYGEVRAVDDISFSIPEGSVTGFLGPNGAGKSTTIRLIVGAIPPTSGTVRVSGCDVRRSWRDARRRIGYLPESAPLYPEMRVEEFLAFRARLHAVPRRARPGAIGRALGQCNLVDVRRRLIGQLSKGFRQRVGLAAALVHDPAVLVLDEPTAGLDPAQVVDFRSLLRSLSGRSTILVSSHILSEIEAVCDRIIMINGGRLVASGDLASFRARGTVTGRYVVETDRTTDGIEHLHGVAGVTHTALPDGWHRTIVIATRAADDLREPIAAWAQAGGRRVRELHREEESLESHFMRLAREGRSVDADIPDEAKA